MQKYNEYIALPQVCEALHTFKHSPFKFGDAVLELFQYILISAYRYASEEGVNAPLPQNYEQIVQEAWENSLHWANTDARVRDALKHVDPKSHWDLAYASIEFIGNPTESTDGAGSISRGKRWLIHGAIHADWTGELAGWLSAFFLPQPPITEVQMGSLEQQFRDAWPDRDTWDGPWGTFPGLTYAIFGLKISEPPTEDDKICVYHLLREFFKLGMNVVDTWLYFWNEDPSYRPTDRQIEFAMLQARWSWEAEARSPFNDIPFRVKELMAAANFEGNFRFLAEHILPKLVQQQRLRKEGLGYAMYQWLWKDGMMPLPEMWKFWPIYQEMREKMGLAKGNTAFWRPPLCKKPEIAFEQYEGDEEDTASFGRGMEYARA